MSFEGVTKVSYFALWLVVVVQTLVLFEVLRQLGILRMRMPPEPGALLTDEGLSRGALAPSFQGPNLSAGDMFSDSQLRGRKAVLVFLAPNCAGCQMLVSDLGRFTREHDKRIGVVIICTGTTETCSSLVGDLSRRVPVLLDQEQQISHSYRVRRTPSVSVVNESGRILIHGVPNNLGHLEGLLAEEGSPMLHQWIDSQGVEEGTRTA